MNKVKTREEFKTKTKEKDKNIQSFLNVSKADHTSDDDCFRCPRGGRCNGNNCSVINSTVTKKVLEARFMSRGSASRVK